MRAASFILRWAAVAVLVWVALDPINPWLLVLRDWVVPLVAGVALAGLAWSVRSRARRRLGRGEASVLVVACSIAATLSLANGLAFQAQRTAVLAGGEDLRRVGQHFIVGYRDFEEAARLAERGLIGGVYLGRHNVRGRSLAEIRAEIDALQALRTRAGLPPLIVAADQEGGAVAHMTPPLSKLPPLAELVRESAMAGLAPEALAAHARAYGEHQGRELGALGVNLNFGPVADLRPAGRGPRFDTHTLLHRRAIDGDPAVVALVAAAYAEGLAARGVGATLKHFPGLGGVEVDTHHFPARLPTPTAVLQARDWLPFRTAARHDGAIMLGHVVLPEIDPERPASLSPAVVRGLLREGWGYEGLLVTDDINMGAVYRRGPCRTAVAALEAGVDLVLVSYDPDQFYRAIHCAAAASRAGSLDPLQAAASGRRIAALAGARARGTTAVAANLP